MTESRARLTTALADRYRIERELGQGGMATVYLARDLKHDRDVALKVLRPEITAILGSARFLQEIRISAGLDHPHILTLIDSGEAEGVLYYVLPYVRGESLRQKIMRERQLSIEESLAITRQVASALDYAHRQGVIHRDIKPENILLYEGEAMLADFGIALAVKEAGGNRLTETGISLGTPQYMSPEQATGERELDARSDIYSLAAVLYEMLAGEPPHTGPTVQAVITKLLTERPTRLRVVRDTVPEEIDAAVAKALAKIPADRFTTADAFVGALEPGAPGRAGRRAVHMQRRHALVAIGGTVLALAGLFWLVLRGHGRPSIGAYLNRTQITFTGNASHPALSPDGSQIAYVASDCSSGACRFAIQVQDLAGGGARRLVDDATFIWSLWWSPDHRFLIFAGALESKFGAYLVPILGGPPRFLGSGFATFTPNGDSILLTESSRSDTASWIWVLSLDGVRRDSFLVHHPSAVLLGAGAFPGKGGWTGVGLLRDAGVEVRIIDRRGVTSDSLPFGGFSPPRGSNDAMWMGPLGDLTHGPLVRVPLDLVHGKFGASQDTVFDVADEGFDVTADGGTLAYADGTFEYGVWALDLDDALRGRFEPAHRLLASTSFLVGWPSPNGSQVLALRAETGPSAGKFALTVLPFAGGRGVDLSVVPSPWSKWSPDSRLVAYGRTDSTGVRLVALDPASGAIRRTRAITDGDANDWAVLVDSGWAWIPYSGSSIRVQYDTDRTPRDLPAPEDFRRMTFVQASPDARRIATEGFGQGDSLLVYEVSLPEGAVTRLAAFGPPVLWSYANWLDDGGLLICLSRTASRVTLYRLSRSGHIESLGTIPRPVSFAQSALDGRRMVVTTVEFHGDIWIARRSAPR